MFVKANTHNTQSDTLMKILPLVLEIMLASKEVGVLISSSVCLKTYVTHLSKPILKMYKPLISLILKSVRNYLPKIVEVIHKMLSIETDEMASLYIGNLIILVFANVIA